MAHFQDFQESVDEDLERFESAQKTAQKSIHELELEMKMKTEAANREKSNCLNLQKYIGKLKNKLNESDISEDLGTQEQTLNTQANELNEKLTSTQNETKDLQKQFEAARKTVQEMHSKERAYLTWQQENAVLAQKNQRKMDLSQEIERLERNLKQRILKSGCDMEFQLSVENEYKKYLVNCKKEVS